jgi:Xaa-Pro aminopeptidase
MSVTDKYKLIAKKMHKNLNMMLLTNLDDIAWLLNLRGNDILYNPLFFSYVIFHKDKNSSLHSVDLFIKKEKIDN